MGLGSLGFMASGSGSMAQGQVYSPISPDTMATVTSTSSMTS